MSRQAMIISVLLAAGLTLVAVAVFMGPPATTLAGQGEPLLAINPASVTAIRVADHEYNTVEIVERLSGGGWRFRTELADGSSTPPWPVNPARVRGLLSELSQLTPMGASQRDATITGNSTNIVIEQAQAPNVTLKLGDNPIGGRILVSVNEGAPVLIDDQIRRVFTSPGPSGWRDTSAMPGVGADASRLTLRTNDTQLSLARIQGVWHLTSPVEARASTKEAMKLLGFMANLSVSRFLDDADDLDDADTGLDEPAYTLIAETDRRHVDTSGNVAIATDRRVLRIGRRANVSGTALYATPNAGVTLFVVRAEALDELATDPAVYTAPTATGVAASDVGMVVISTDAAPDRGYRRDINGWTRLTREGSQPLDNPAPLEALLTFLSEAEASEVSFTAPDSYQKAGEVTLLDFESSPVERLVFGYDAGGDLLVVSGGAVAGVEVFRLYPQRDQIPDALKIEPAR